MFMWLGYKLGSWVDYREELYKQKNPNTVVFETAWIAYASMGFIVDLFIACAVFVWFRMGMPL